MKNHLRRIDPGEQPGVDLAARHDIEPNSLLDQNAHQRRGEVSLPGVDQPRLSIGAKKRIPDPPGACSQGLLIEYIEGGAELASQLHGEHSSELEGALGGASSRSGQDISLTSDGVCAKLRGGDLLKAARNWPGAATGTAAAHTGRRDGYTRGRMVYLLMSHQQPL